MTVRQIAEVTRPLGGVADLPLWRLNLMRVGYAVMGVGLAMVRWPDVIGYDGTMPLYEGVVAVLLTAMSLLAFLGLRYPVRLLPILLFESLWKKGDRWRAHPPDRQTITTPITRPGDPRSSPRLFAHRGEREAARSRRGRRRGDQGGLAW
jgi:hypothetical protein